jgi:hypothetical protein
MIGTHFQKYFRIRRTELVDRDCHGAGRSRVEDLPSRHIEPISLERYLSFPRLMILRSCSIVRETVKLTLRHPQRKPRNHSGRRCCAYSIHLLNILTVAPTSASQSNVHPDRTTNHPRHQRSRGKPANAIVFTSRTLNGPCVCKQSSVLDSSFDAFRRWKALI